ncbi:MAG: cupin domain-containing protein [Betaproteobacteria bacterium]
MRRHKLSLREGFRVIGGNRRSQAAEMMIAPGEGEGGPGNRHRGADQWLHVLSGRGVALMRTARQTHRYTLVAGTLLFIERGRRHEIRNTGRRPLRTLNFYVPPAYRSNGDPLPRGKK